MIVHVDRISGRNGPCFEHWRLDSGSIFIHVGGGRWLGRWLTLSLALLSVLISILAGCRDRCGIGFCSGSARIDFGLQSSLPSGLPFLYFLHEDLWARGGFLRRGPLLGV